MPFWFVRFSFLFLVGGLLPICGSSSFYLVHKL
nr:MAG TPA: hypothetical protein [Caudoviricetes sp.]